MILEDILNHLNLMEFLLIIGAIYYVKDHIDKVRCDLYFYLKDCEKKKRSGDDELD